MTKHDVRTAVVCPECGCYQAHYGRLEFLCRKCAHLICMWWFEKDDIHPREVKK